MIKKDDAFAIFATVLKGFENKVDTYIQQHGLNLKKNQRDALVAVAYQYGNILGFAEAYNTYGDTEELRNAFTVNGGAKPFGNGDSRKEANWKLFSTSIYIARDGTEIKSGIIDMADSIHKYMEANGYKYCVSFSNSYEEHSNISQCGLNATFEESKTGYHHSCCATYVSWVLQESGYLDRSEHTNSAGTLSDRLINKGWKIINSVSELEPGDVIYYSYGHIEIYAGGGKVYNAGSGSVIRSASPASKDVSGMTHGLRAPN